MASGGGIIKGVKGFFQKPAVKTVVKTLFPDPMANFKYSEVLWNFRNKETLEQWTLITDEQFGGKSTAEFVRSPGGKAVFKGNISTELPAATNVKYSGMCSIRSQPQRDRKGDVTANEVADYDGIVVRLRGDGRTYTLNVQTKGIRDDDIHQSFFHTRGGPYWEIVRLPFTKFVLTNAGYLQDQQMYFPRIRTVGFTLADHNTGPFHLEIDYIKLVMFMYQPKHFKYHYQSKA
ncbi:complex I intermediate-associated protein 30, mitochondrial-like [Orbicella faveolata]|uniref:complex I intermediate-associated protein 30, mitochondrial-like n=1 Tax=Orbicella faveolata TaxID=48498 RepID=UPI0009E4C7F4|nr:complex I intermediate-associated protein 30, mitochondrial-like [Orbicella faveolata]XP_020627732.1 complex I intermediate-associated protein 30, mitochondrial-like [Orbicella faveolata]